MTENRRKLLFVIFSDETCRMNHALLYAIDLERAGHAVRVIVEGPATAAFGRLGEESMTARLLGQAIERGLVVGACRTASGGCSTGDVRRKVADAVRDAGVALLDDLDGHAGVARFIDEGYELVAF